MQIIILVSLFLTMLMQVIIPPIPAELIVIISGKVNGVILTTLIAGSGLFIGSLIVYYIGFYVSKKFNNFFNKEKIIFLVNKFRKRDNIFLFIRILPYNPSDIISYAAGILKIAKKKYIIITAITSFIRVLLLAIMGSFISNLKTVFIILSLLIIFALVAYIIIYKN